MLKSPASLFAQAPRTAPGPAQEPLLYAHTHTHKESSCKMLRTQNDMQSLALHGFGSFFITPIRNAGSKCPAAPLDR